MRKKQLFKINCSGRTKAMGLSVTALMLAVAMSGSVFAAGNIEDSGYSYNSTKNGFATPTRPKVDDTSSYINHSGTKAASVQVRSYGINYSANGGSYYVKVGSARYLPNYVYENGKRNCYLYITPSPAQSALMYGEWSPDSV